MGRLASDLLPGHIAKEPHDSNRKPYVPGQDPPFVPLALKFDRKKCHVWPPSLWKDSEYLSASST